MTVCSFFIFLNIQMSLIIIKYSEQLTLTNKNVAFDLSTIRYVSAEELFF